MSGIGSAVLLIVTIALYFLPTILASVRGNRRVAQVAVVNAFLGWTVIAWIICLAWSLEPQTKETA